MMPAKQRLLFWGLRAGLVYSIATHLLFFFRDDRLHHWFSSQIFLGYMGSALFGLLFRTEAQVEWYRRSVCVPGAVPWGVFLAASALNLGFIALATLYLSLLACPVILIVWLTGAIVIHRRRRRESTWRVH